MVRCWVTDPCLSDVAFETPRGGLQVVRGVTVVRVAACVAAGDLRQ